LSDRPVDPGVSSRLIPLCSIASQVSAACLWAPGRPPTITAWRSPGTPRAFWWVMPLQETPQSITGPVIHRDGRRLLLLALLLLLSQLNRPPQQHVRQPPSPARKSLLPASAKSKSVSARTSSFVFGLLTVWHLPGPQSTTRALLDLVAGEVGHRVAVRSVPKLLGHGHPDPDRHRHGRRLDHSRGRSPGHRDHAVMTGRPRAPQRRAVPDAPENAARTDGTVITDRPSPGGGFAVGPGWQRRQGSRFR
jgi:hypothetical protein